MITYYFKNDTTVGLPYNPDTKISYKAGDQISGTEYITGFVSWTAPGGLYVLPINKFSLTPIQPATGNQPGAGGGTPPHDAGPNYLYWGIGITVTAALGFATYWFGFRKKSKII
jgi:hypothetical protein